MRKQRNQPSRPQPPEHLEGEALLEWHRVCDELEALGTLHESDRGILTLYANIWNAHHQVAKHVAQWGPVVELNNKTIAQSKWYQTMMETGQELRQLQAALGITPTARAKGKATEVEAPKELEY